MSSRVALGELVSLVLLECNSNGAQHPGSLLRSSTNGRTRNRDRTRGHGPEVDDRCVFRKLGTGAGNSQIVGPDQLVALANIYGNALPGEVRDPGAQFRNRLGGRRVHYIPR